MLLLALLLALDAALGAGAATPYAEHVSRTLAAAALAIRAAATASSQCSGTTNPGCKGFDDDIGGVVAKCSTSSDLSAAGCDAWLDFYDSTGGAGWTDCSQHRLDPCSCYTGSTDVECKNSHITAMYARGSHAQLPSARSRRPLSVSLCRPPTAAATNPRLPR